MSKTISDKSWYYGVGVWSYKFPCLVGKKHLARILRREAVKLRLEAVRLEVTLLNANLATDLHRRADALDRDAEWAVYGHLEASCYQVPTFEADMLQRRTLAILADEVSTWTLQNADCYPRVRLWLEFAELLYAVNINDVLDMLATRQVWLHPRTEMVEEYVQA